VENGLQIVLTSAITVLASSGFWAYIMRKDNNKSATTRLLMGLAYEKLMDKGEKYIDRGWISRDEYEDYQKYFFEPYKALGGNGVAERIMNGVSDLPIVGHDRHAMMFHVRHQNEEYANNVRVVKRRSEREAAPE
jgi:hypothetical protein